MTRSETSHELDPIPDTAQRDAVDQPHTVQDKRRMSSAALSFFLTGLNDGALGALLPYILRAYNINTDRVAILYAATFAGWLSIALTNTYLAQCFDLGMLLAMGAFLQVLSQALRVWQPSFALYTVTFLIQSLGIALQDTHANNYVATVQNAHRWLGVIHAMYALGCGVGPFIATPIASATDPSRWYLYYAVLIGIGVVNLVFVVIAFGDTLKLRSKRRTESVGNKSTTLQSALTEFRAVLSQRAVWLLSLYFFFFLGAVITASGWVVEFLVRVRGGNLSKMGYVAAGLSGGTFLGRLLLAEPTKRFGERYTIFTFTVLCLALELIFWLVPNIVVNIIAITLFGFFSGPFFATGVHVGTQLFPVDLRSGSLAVVFMLGQVGASIFPAITGLLASRKGVQVLQPMLVGLCSATAITWLLIPRLRHHAE